MCNSIEKGKPISGSYSDLHLVDPFVGIWDSNSEGSPIFDNEHRLKWLRAAESARELV